MFIISSLIIIPLVAAFGIMFLKPNSLQQAKLITMCTSFLIFSISIIVLFLFDFAQNTIQFVEEYNWLPKRHIQYKIGLDQCSIFFVLMISIICCLLTVLALKKKVPQFKYFLSSILLFESSSIGAFMACDMFSLLFFMELTIIPLFVMMHVSEKGPNKTFIMQFLLYEMVSSLLIMASIIMIYNYTHTSDMVKICEHTQAIPSICFWIMFAGVAVKLPMFPCHNWLPNVHVKSPTICSVLFASIVLKFSTLLFVKLLHPLFSAEINTYSNLLIGVCLLGAIFACANLFFQNDLKKIFAYFSILHMNLYLIILLSGSNTSIFIFSALYHSFIMATLFFITDLIETLFKTRNVTELQGVALPSLKVKGFMLAAVLMLIGAPPSWGFIAEVMTMHYAYHTSIYVAEMVCLCMLVSSSRVLFIYQKIFSKWSTNTEICTNHRSLQNAIIYVTFVIILAVGTFPCLLKFS